MKRAWPVIVMVMLALVWGPGCSKKKKKTTPKNPPAQAEKKGEGANQGSPEAKTEQSTEQTAVQQDQNQEQTQSQKGTQKGETPKGGSKAKNRPKIKESAIQELRRLLRQGSYKDLEKKAHELLTKDHENYEAMEIMAEGYMEWGKPELSIRVLRHIKMLSDKKKRPVGCRWHYLMGRYLLVQARTLERMGLVLRASGFKTSALKEFTHKSCGGMAAPLFYGGMLYIEDRQFTKGLATLQKALSLARQKGDPIKDDPRLHMNLGVAYYQQHQWKKAYDEWLIALSLKKNRCPECHYNLALLCSLDSVSPSSLGMGGDLKAKARCLKTHARAYKRYLDQRRIRDKRLNGQVKEWLAKAASMMRRSR